MATFVWISSLSIILALQLQLSTSQKNERDQRREFVVETLIVADDTVMIRFNSQIRTQQYLMEMVRLANILLEDEDLPIRIRLKVVKIEWLNPTVDILSNSGPHLTAAVQRFCAVAYSTYYHDYRYDHAVLFTRRIHRYATGISPYGKMCRHPLSCTIVEDTGFTFVFNLAHEIMHSLGVDHDGEDNSCPEQSGRGNIMAPIVRSKWTIYHWSACTVRALKFNVSEYPCISSSAVSNYDKSIPKRIWSREDQCRILLGFPESFTFFVNPNSCPQSCHKIWCPSVYASGSCVPYKSIAPSPGSQCGFRSVCQQGQCVPESRPTNPVNLRYNCSLCTSSGITVQIQNCKPSSSHCLNGRNLVLRKCHTINQNCRNRKSDVRELQCQRAYGTTATAIHFERSPCTSICEKRGEFSSLGPLPDGTPCHFNDSSNICVRGRCLSFDCLGQYGGRAATDVCGVCRGNGSSCSRVSLRIPVNVSRRNGSILHTFPRGAKDILISKLSANFNIYLTGTQGKPIRVMLDYERMARITDGMKFGRKELPHGFSLIYGKGVLLSPNIKLQIQWIQRNRGARNIVYITYVNASILDKIQIPSFS